MRYALLPKAFVVWFCTQLPKTLLHIFINTNLLLESEMAIRLHARLLFVPLFHDTTIVGRFISVLFRIARVIGGIIALCAVNILLAPFLLSILLSPLLPVFFRPAFILWPVIFIFYAIFLFDRPTKRITADLPVQQVFQTFYAQTRKLFGLLGSNPAPFFAAAAANDQIQELFTRAGYNPAILATIAKAPGAIVAKKQTLLAPILETAKRSGAQHVTPIHLITALVEPGTEYGVIFARHGIQSMAIFHACQWMTAIANARQKPQVWDDNFFDVKIGGVNRGWVGVPTPTLDSVSTDITVQASKFQLPEIIGRQQTIKEILQILSKGEHDNVLLVGEAGVGKSAIIDKIAELIVAGEVPKSVFSKRLIRLDPSALVAGVGVQGGLEQRMNTIIKEITASDNIILYIADIHALSAISSAKGNINLYDLLKPHLSSTRFQVIGTTTTENYQRYLEPNTDFLRLFQTLQVPEVSEAEAIEIMQYIAPAIEQKHQVIISYPALAASVTLSTRYVHDRTLPGKAKDLLDEASVAISNQNSKVVTPQVIESLIEQKTHIPVHNATAREKDALLHLEAKIHEQFIDQEDAVAAVANAMRRARTQMTDTDRPIASFLFVGPTGVGKTELAKTLAKTYFGVSDAFVRFDMSEFQEPLSVYRLIGAPPSTGENQPGQLTEAVRQKPFCLLLFDEIEKAHPKILDLFLQMLEDGRLTDSDGHTATFKDTIIIATSNAGTMQIEQLLASGMNTAQIQENIVQILSESFRIEYINRFDDIIVFQPLDLVSVMAITKLMLAEVTKSLAAKGFHVTFGDDVIRSLAERGYDPQLGARPLRRLIENEVESTIAKLLLSDKLPKGKKVVLTMAYFTPQAPLVQ